MALVKKSGETILDPADSTIELSAPYGRINVKNIGYGKCDGLIVVEFYRRICTNEEIANKVILPYGNKQFSITKTDYDTYFSPSVIEADKDDKHQAYLFVMTVEEQTGQDENGDPIMEKVLRQWESDEV